MRSGRLRFKTSEQFSWPQKSSSVRSRPWICVPIAPSRRRTRSRAWSRKSVKRYSRLSRGRDGGRDAEQAEKGQRQLGAVEGIDVELRQAFGREPAALLDRHAGRQHRVQRRALV